MILVSAYSGMPAYAEAVLEIARWEDPERTAPIEQVASPELRDAFRPLPGARFGVTSSRSAWWIRVRVEPAPTGPRVLYLDGTQLDDLQLFRRQADADGWQRVATGEERPFSTRPIRDPAFAFPLSDWTPGEELYLRLAGNDSLATRIEVFSETGFRQRQFRSHLIFGAYYAFVGSLVLYNLILLLSVRDLAYLGYVVYLGSITLFHASRAGHAAMLLWPESPWWGARAAAILALSALLGGMLLAWELCNARALPRWIQRCMLGSAGVALLLAVLVFVDLPLSLTIGIPFIAGFLLFMPVPIVAALRRGYRPARFLLVGLALVGPGALLWGANYSGLLAPSPIGEHALKLTVVLEALLFSFALADRIRVNQEARTRAEQRLLEAQHSISQQLLRAQDEERRRVARHLHDGLGQPLLALSNRLERRLEGQPDARELIGLSRQAIDEVRALSRGLHPHRLDLVGLPDAIRELAAESLESAGIEARMEIDEVEGLPAATSLHLYRIAQEAIANVMRHAEARSVCLALRERAGRLELVVEDDGVGDPHQLAPGGLGTASILERARSLGGTARYEAARPRGLRLVVTVPR